MINIIKKICSTTRPRYLFIILFSIFIFIVSNIFIVKINKKAIKQLDNKYNIEINNLRNDIHKKDKDIKNKDKEINNQKKVISDLNNKIININNELNNKKIEIDNKNKELVELKKKLISKRNRCSISRGSFNSGRSIGRFRITFYTPYEGSIEGKTARGNKAIPYKTIAVDPRIIPLGTKLYIESLGVVIADDTGGAINGNRIDYCVSSKIEASRLGIKYLDVYLVK